MINVIAKISTRFLSVARDRSLWRGDVFLELAENTEDGPRFPISSRDATVTLRFSVASCLNYVTIKIHLFRSIINGCLSDGTLSLLFLVPMLVPPRGTIKPQHHPLMSFDDLLILAESCPKLSIFDDRRFLRLSSWPRCRICLNFTQICNANLSFVPGFTLLGLHSKSCFYAVPTCLLICLKK